MYDLSQELQSMKPNRIRKHPAKATVNATVTAAALASWVLVQSVSVPSIAVAQDVIPVVLHGEDNNKPYAFLNADGAPAGIYVRILQAAVDKMPQYDLRFENVPFKRGMDLLQSGQIMAFFPPYLRDDRNWVERYSVPILSETVVAICSKDYVLSHDLRVFPDDFTGARFANNAGYRLAGEDFFDMVAAGEITLEEANTTESNLRFLMAGRVDCYVNERMAILAGLRELAVDKEQSRNIDETAIIGQEFGYVAFGPDPDGSWPYRDQFADDLDDVLRQMRDSGEIDQLVVEYFAY